MVVTGIEVLLQSLPLSWMEVVCGSFVGVQHKLPLNM